MIDEPDVVVTGDGAAWPRPGAMRTVCLAAVMALGIGAAAHAQGPHQSPPPPPPPPPPENPIQAPWAQDPRMGMGEQPYPDAGASECWTQTEDLDCMRLKLDLSANRGRVNPHDAATFAQRLREIDRLEADLRDRLGELNREIPDPGGAPR